MFDYTFLYFYNLGATIFKEHPPLSVFKGLEFFNLNLQITINLIIALNVFLKMLQKCVVKCTSYLPYIQHRS